MEGHVQARDREDRDEGRVVMGWSMERGTLASLCGQAKPVGDCV